MLRYFALFLVVGLMLGCVHVEEITKETPQRILSPIALGEKPPEIVVGSKFLYKRTNAITGESMIFIQSIKNKVDWMGSPAYVVELMKEEALPNKGYSTFKYALIDSNLNMLAAMNKEGQLIEAVSGNVSIVTPKGTTIDGRSIVVYNWPLKVGDAFSVTYETFNKSANQTVKNTDQVKVEQKTMIRNSNIGSWLAYKIRHTAPGMIETRYYSPDLGLEIRQEVNQTIDNPQGAGVFVVDMIGYSIPGVGEKGEKIKLLK